MQTPAELLDVLTQDAVLDSPLVKADDHALQAVPKAVHLEAECAAALCKLPQLRTEILQSLLIDARLLGQATSSDVIALRLTVFLRLRDMAASTHLASFRVSHQHLENMSTWAESLQLWRLSGGLVVGLLCQAQEHARCPNTHLLPSHLLWRRLTGGCASNAAFDHLPILVALHKLLQLRHERKQVVDSRRILVRTLLYIMVEDGDHTSSHRVHPTIIVLCMACTE
mmetsp:Transcript_101863/g.242847  ORF Transcript_101863/g.242847 Transcript_101863/m.242847 type:complete len:226 (+) Transcript_101863:337-1014(+)